MAPTETQIFLSVVKGNFLLSFPSGVAALSQRPRGSCTRWRVRGEGIADLLLKTLQVCLHWLCLRPFNA